MSTNNQPPDSSNDSSPEDNPQLPSTTKTTTTTPFSIDSQISQSASLTYWSQIPTTNNGMLGGYEEVTTPDLKHSKKFITQVRRILQSSPQPTPKITRAVDCGAGIGRITKGLLVKIAETVDVVEPIAKFAAQVAESQEANEGEGQVSEIFVQGLESWVPPPDRRYGLIWNQWCLGHLTDAQLVSYLRRAAGALTGSTAAAADSKEEKGWIMVKENLSKEEDGDIFDGQDSSVTRTDRNFRRIFAEAGLNVIKAGRQENFPSELYTVMMYALRPS